MTGSEKTIPRLFAEAKARSTCRQIRLGVVIEAADGRCVLGWNGPPERAGKHTRCRLGKEISPDNIRNCPAVHAEVRAVCRAAEAGIPTAGATLYLSQWYPCAPCALVIIEAGIARLVLNEEPNFAKDDCYNFRLAREYLKKAGVEMEVINNSNFNLKERR